MFCCFLCPAVGISGELCPQRRVTYQEKHNPFLCQGQTRSISAPCSRCPTQWGLLSCATQPLSGHGADEQQVAIHRAVIPAEFQPTHSWQLCQAWHCRGCSVQLTNCRTGLCGGQGNKEGKKEPCTSGGWRNTFADGKVSMSGCSGKRQTCLSMVTQKHTGTHVLALFWLCTFDVAYLSHWLPNSPFCALRCGSVSHTHRYKYGSLPSRNIFLPLKPSSQLDDALDCLLLSTEQCQSCRHQEWGEEIPFPPVSPFLYSPNCSEERKGWSASLLLLTSHCVPQNKTKELLMYSQAD